MTDTNNQAQVDQAVAQGTAYEVIRQRLEEQGKTLAGHVSELNASRESEFGSTDMAVIGRARARTENNCVPRDIVRVGDHLLFGYNVFLGLKSTTTIADVFNLYKLHESDGSYEIEPTDIAGTFLDDDRFKQDFKELYAYYKSARLIQVQQVGLKLTATFQIGKKLTDVRVFRWALEKDGQTNKDTAKYIDNRGERDVQPPAQQDFAWTLATREDQTLGKHPHVNVLDTVFVDTIGGNLTIKIEDNTKDGFGIYNEKVSDPHQSLDDAEIFYARVGSLVLLKIRPYQEDDFRYLIFNTLTEQVTRIDEMGDACIQLPEDHGLIFPGGYYLQSGETKSYGDTLETEDLQFVRAIRSPNGEDVLYVFYEPEEGRWLLLAYNLINKALQNPIDCHGYSLFNDGRAVLFTAESDEPTRVHPMQIWQTPFYSDEYASQQPTPQTPLGKIGNAELVRGISDLYSITRGIREQAPTTGIYEELIAATRRAFDAYYWLDQFADISQIVHDIANTAELVLDEFAKVQAIRQQANKALQQAEAEQKKLLNSIAPTSWKTPVEFVSGLDSLRKQRGHLLTIRELRYINTDRIDELDAELAKTQDDLSQQTVTFIGQPEALDPYFAQIQQAESDLENLETVAQLEPLNESLEQMGAGLDLLNDLLGSLKITDATERTRILESISEVYGKLNQLRAKARHKRKDLQSGEAVAEFGALIKLFDQSVTNAVGDADTPEECDDELSRLLLQLQELESQFADFDDFLADILAKREELYETLESKKQQLIQQRQRRSQTLADAAERILAGIGRRSKQFQETDELNTYFSSDPMIAKLREMIEELRSIDAAVRADDIDAKLKAAKDQALRGLRDKQDIFEDGGKTIKLGKHKFSVNTQPLDLTLIPRQVDGEAELAVHLTGTDFYETVHQAELDALKPYWDIERASESPDVYRAEFLASEILQAAEQNQNNLSLDKLGELLADQQALLKFVRDFAAPRYQDGYEKGIHDHDAAAILNALWPVYQAAGLLRYSPIARALAQLFWVQAHADKQLRWQQWAQSAAALQQTFASGAAFQELQADLLTSIAAFAEALPATLVAASATAAEYLAFELAAKQQPHFATSQTAKDLAEGMLKKAGKQKAVLEKSLQGLQNSPADSWDLVTAWLQAYVQSHDDNLAHYIPEAAAYLLADVDRDVSALHLDAQAHDLMGEHGRIEGQQLLLRLDDFMQRLSQHRQVVIPAYERIIELRQELLQSERNRLNLDSFKARPLSSFVRNKLINDVYLPIIGDNLAKQMGAAGAAKRTDLMGLLLLISPPGYGKTTLMEYVANRLGLIFVKVNAPALGHSVTSIDPSTAPNAAARQELEKLNLALEMGNNVMLYLDDIQHTHPEFLQKFIALCDATRRIEGVWNGQPKTYDMRGKKFCVVMAGNPYTESGDMFQIPDMLANRADIYNLGDVLSGREKQFALSYIENGLTSNPVLAPLATREMDDVYKLVEMAEGENVASTDLKHDYSRAEIEEITTVLQKLFVVRDVILKVNQAYIQSAATAETYRVEPPFKLQGSYRNINKVGEKIASVMTDDELTKLIQDHYLGEAQTLTSGAEENLLKLKEITGALTSEDEARWQQIKDEFQLIQKTGGAGADAVTKIARQIPAVTESLQAIAARELDLSSLGENLSTALSTAVSTPLKGIETAVSQSADSHQPTDFSGLATSLSKLEKAIGNRDELASVAQSLAVLSAQSKGNNLELLLDPLTEIRNALQSMPKASEGGGWSPKAEGLLQELHTSIEKRLIPALIMALDNRLLTEEQRREKLGDWNPFA